MSGLRILNADFGNLAIRAGDRMTIPAGWKLGGAGAEIRCEVSRDGPSRLSFDPAAVSVTAAAGDGDSRVPTFEMTAYTGAAMMIAGWFEPVVVDLEGVTLRTPNPPILRDHDTARVVGHAQTVDISAQRIRVSGLISGAGDDAEEVVASSLNGFPWGASIGANVTVMEFVSAGASVKVNGRNFDGPCFVARKAEVHEISFVAIAGDPRSRTKVAAQAAEEHAMNFEAWLSSRGLVRANLPAERLTELRAEYDRGVAAGTITASPAAPAVQAAQPPAAPPAQPVAASPAAPTVQAAGEPASADSLIQARRQALAAEAEREAGVIRLTPNHPTIRAQAIREGWGLDRTEVEVLRASRPTSAPNAIVRGGFTPTGPVLEAALCQSCRLQNLEKHFDAATLEAAHQAFRGHIGLGEVLVVAAQHMGGWDRPTFHASDLRPVLQAAFSLNASFSSFSLSGILSNVANKFLLEGFMAVESTWRAIAAVRSVRDFKAVTSYRLTGDFKYDQVGADGELKHGTVDEESYTNQADTYGKMFGIPRKAIINDDLGALSDIPRRIGRGGALKLNDVVWGAFMDNATFFSAGNKNFASGANTALSVDSLTAAEKLFYDQTDPSGNPLGLDAATLLVPNGLWSEAQVLMASREIRDTTASKARATLNPHAGKWTPVRSSYLSRASLTGYSALKWYLLANPAELAAVEVAFLNGKESPTVETADADFNVLGIQMRGYHDFGASQQEYRAGVAMKGEA